MKWSACANAPHTWIFEDEAGRQVKVLFPETAAAFLLTEELERQVVEAYGHHLQCLSDWTPHEYGIREQDIQYTLAGRAAFW